MHNIGYLEGTDPLVLANLSIAGHSTIPLGNGYDNHGKFIGHLTKDDNVSLVVGYFHKVLPARDMPMTIKDMLSSCVKLNIPMLLICGREYYGEAKELLGDLAERVRLTAPEKLEEVIRNMLSVVKKYFAGIFAIWVGFLGIFLTSQYYFTGFIVFDIYQGQILSLLR